jgi:alpha-galactosidase
VADIWPDEAAGTWLLRLRSSAYALGLAGDGAAVRHLYWGPDLDPAAAGPVLALARQDQPRERYRSWALERPDEYVPWGGLRFDEPSLKVEYADGTRAVEWHYAGQRISRDGPAVTLEVDLADDQYGLTVTLAYRGYDGFDVLERWATLSQAAAGAPVVIRQAHAANWWLPPGQRWRLRYLHGSWGAETQLAQATLGPGQFVLESRRGTTSHQFNPWFTLDAGGTATEESGEVYSGELGWSGSWKLVFEQTSAGRLHVGGGWNEFDWSQPLGPGERLVLPTFAGLYTAGGFGAASREWHAWQRACLLGRGDRTGLVTPRWHAAARAESRPAADGEPALRPVLYNSWEATAFAVSEDGQERLAQTAARLGVELFVVDDGWFRGRNHDHAGLGDWTPDPAKFPRGLSPLITRVSQLGMAFGLWVEPEMVNPDSDLYRAHPDWVYHFSQRTRSEHRNQLVLNLARPDVADYLYQSLDRLLAEHDIRFVKWDMNRPFSEPGWPAEAGRYPERAWVEHVRTLYALIDALRAAHPGVDFESCSGGGGRVDLGILRRVEQVWTSDNTDAWDRVAIQEGFSQAYSPSVMMAWVTDSPNPMTGRRLPLAFRFHVAMAGSLGIGADLTQWSEAEVTEAANLVAEYKEIRPVIQRGRLYRLASVSADSFGASEYLAADGSEAVVLAWWGPGQCRAELPRLRLAGLADDARYVVPGTGAEHRGAELARIGLALPGPQADFGSALIRLVRS